MQANDLKYLEQHIADAGRVELRAMQPSGPIISGLFDNVPKLVDVIHDLRRDANLYYTAQAPRLRSVPNQMGTGALSNADIASFTRIVFDLDVVRDKGHPADEAQIESALVIAYDIRKFLYDAGWPVPVIIWSGHGIHMIYRTPPIPNTPEYNTTLRVLYEGMALEFTTPAATFDRTVRNAARIMRCPGSYNWKVTGEERWCLVFEYPTRWSQVQQRNIEAVARVLAPKPAPRNQATPKSQRVDSAGDYSTLDVVSWFTAHHAYIRPLGGAVHAVLCPWTDEHTTPSGPQGGDTVIFENTDTWPGFDCKHAHCYGRRIRDVMGVWGDADAFCARPYAGRGVS